MPHEKLPDCCGPASPKSNKTGSIEYMQIQVGEDIISYRLSGLPLELDRLVVVLLHGWGRSKEDFDQLTADLAAGGLRAAFLQVDLPGFGGSTLRTADGYSLDDYCQSLEHLFEKLNVKRAVLIGHSFGGRIAIKLAATHPQRVEQLVLIAAAGIPRRSLWLKLIAVGVLLWKLATAGLRDTRLIRRLTYTLTPFVASEDYRTAPPQLRETLKKIIREDLRPAATLIRAPTLLIWSREDEVTPLAVGQAYQALIGNSRLEIIEGVGHFPFLKHPDKCSRIIASFLLEHGGSERPH